jgi:toxin-antitoxin system PIN domain toxin
VRALDTNVLIYAEIRNSTHHDRARALLTECAEGAAAWAIPWPCIYEFLRVVTHPRVYHPPVPSRVALADIAAILMSPSLILLSETDRHAEIMADVVRSAGASGNLIHDAHIAALCVEHGVTQIVTGDRDFLRFEGLTVVDPFAE